MVPVRQPCSAFSLRWWLLIAAQLLSMVLMWWKISKRFASVGYMRVSFRLYQDLTVEENLAFFATLFNTSIDENYELVKDIYVQIEKIQKRKAGALSGGMKQKLALSCALIHRPSVLFLDEPTTGVDAVSRKEFWELLRNLQKQNITIVVSTPYMDEASLCDRGAHPRRTDFKNWFTRWHHRNIRSTVVVIPIKQHVCTHERFACAGWSKVMLPIRTSCIT